MYSFQRRVYGLRKTLVSDYTHLTEHCFSIESLDFARIIHAQLIKLGLNGITFLGNRCLELFFKLGAPCDDALKVFDDINEKNTISWNICLKGLLKFGHFGRACSLFDEIPVRDVVSWNSMISGCASCGYVDYALGMFVKMQNAGVRPSEFTYSILTQFVSCAGHGKQIHGSMIRTYANLSNVVTGNSLIGMYGKLGLVNYAFGVFLTMQEVDVVSWNSLISCCCKSGHEVLALNQFCLMRSIGYPPDQFTISTLITVCTNLQHLGMGKQIFAHCVKAGFLRNSIVSSSIIDLFSKCNRLEDSVRLFDELEQWNSAVCSSMISCYAWHGLLEDALRIFILAFREDLRPTEFTLSSVLSSISFLSAVQGSQVHSLVIKLGFESEAVVANSLVEMYTKVGLIDHAMKIFSDMHIRDLISWNTFIMGLARNGRVLDTLDIFMDLLRNGPPPNQITFAGFLLACNYGALVSEGMRIFSLMEEEYKVAPSDEHYACIVDMLCQVGKLKEAIDLMEAMPFRPSSLVWESLLLAAATHEDPSLIERVAERIMALKSQSSSPYLVLLQAYEMRGRWEGMVRVRKAMKERGLNKITECCWIGIKNHVFTFNTNQLQHPGGKDAFMILRLLSWELEDKDWSFMS